MLSAGFEVDKARTAEEALKLVDRADLVLTDLQLPGMDGLELLPLIRRQNAQVPVIVMTAFGTRRERRGGDEGRRHRFSAQAVLARSPEAVVNKALEVRALRDENRQLKEELGRRYEFDNIIGRSPAMQEIFATIERVGPDARHRAAGRRERRRQGSDRARHSLPLAAPRPAASSRSTAPRCPKT